MQLLDGLGGSEVTDSLLDSLCSGAKLTASLVVSDAGDFVGATNSSKELSSVTDRAWLAALRRNSQVVITSGKTFRAEAYRMPKTADLSVLTRTELPSDHLAPKPGQKLHILRDAESYEAAVQDLLKLNYERIHIEFGPQGIKQLLTSGLEFSLFLSGPSPEALEKSAGSLGATARQLCRINDLYLAIAR